MATIKSHTDLSQSKKLAKILPITSIDFAWCIFSNGSTKLLRMDDWEVSENAKSNVEIIPCWSLAALLSVLPKINGLKPILDLEENSLQYTGIDLYVVADNPVDACYEMIIKLYELNLL